MSHYRITVVDPVARVEARDPALLADDLDAAALGCERIAEGLDAIGEVHAYPEHCAMLRKAATEMRRLRAIEAATREYVKVEPIGPAPGCGCRTCTIRHALIGALGKRSE